MSLESDTRNTRWAPLSPSDRGPTAEEVIARADLKWRLYHGPLPPVRHRMFGVSVDDGKLTAILGRDGEWHTVTPPLTGED